MIFAVAIALLAELINLFMAHTIAKRVEKKLIRKYTRIIKAFKRRESLAQEKEDEFSQAKDEYATAIYEAKAKLKDSDQLIKLLRKKIQDQEERLNRYEDLPAASIRKQK